MTHPPIMPTAPGFNSGFVAIVGAPNAGKSTLLNRILGQKISITSKKPQTTRNRILGVLHLPQAQLVFIDTPGVHKASDPLNVRLVETALSSLEEVDVILVLIDAARSDAVSEGLMVKKIKAGKKPVVLALNKIDLMDKNDLLPLIDRWSAVYPFKDIVPVCADTGAQVDRLLAALEKLLPAGPPFFPDDTVTDLPERFIAAEMIREKVFRLTGEEIPYATAVTIEAFEEQKKGALVRIHATIHMERDSQKAIVIGKGGRMLKSIGEKSRLELERFLGVKVFLKLFVRVQKNWSRDTRALRKFGY
ncbi:MAG: GTPase Era [Desulfobacterales bacterium]